jgi:hypothetical protein
MSEGRSVREKILFEINQDTDGILETEVLISEPLEVLSVTVDMKDMDMIMGYLILQDENKNIRFQKLLGYSERVIQISSSSETTTIGGVPGTIGQGKWKLTFCMFTEEIRKQLREQTIPVAFEICGEQCKIEEKIGEECWVSEKQKFPLYYDQFAWNREYQSDTRWYKGDFHTHTRLSDGKETVANAMEKAKQMHMDFYVPTEHNVIHTGWRKTDVMIVPGVEVTAQDGHCNLFGIDRLPSAIRKIIQNPAEEQSEKQMMQILQEAGERGWLVSINHPFLHIWKWKFNAVPLNMIQFLEIINDPTYEYAKEANEKAIRFLDFLWQEGYRIYGIGGSDSHNRIDERYDGAKEPSVAGDPGTYIFCKGLTPTKLLQNLRKGHCYVSRYCTMEIEITADGETYLPGEHIPVGKREAVHIKYHAAIRGLKERPVVYAVVNRVRIGLEVTETEEGVYETETELIFSAGTYEWMRLDVRKEDGAFLGYVNPVYHGAKTPQCRLFGEMLQKVSDML